SRADPAVQLIEVHLLQALVQLGVLGLEARQRLLVEALLVPLALLERPGHPGQHLRLQAEPFEQLRELALDDLCARVGLGALPAVAGAVVVDVASLLGLADHGAAAVAALDEAAEGELVAAPLGPSDGTSVENILYLLPQLAGDDGRLRAPEDATLPLEVAGVDALAEQAVGGGGGDGRARLAEGEAGLARHPAHL